MNKYQAIANKLAYELAEYISELSERELDDYQRHCEENDLIPSHYLINADKRGGHIVAKALALTFYLEQAEQKDAELKAGLE